MKPASFRAVRRYRNATIDAGLVQQVGNACRLRLRENNENLVRFRQPLNFWSFGAHVDIALGRIDGDYVVDITSTGVLGTQVADWGKNERNVRRFFSKLDALLGNECEYEPCTICPCCRYLLVAVDPAVCPECGRTVSADDPHATQEVATIKNAIFFALVVTAVEFFVCVILDLVGLGRAIPALLRGGHGLAFLLFINVTVMFCAVCLHRLVRRFLAKR